MLLVEAGTPNIAEDNELMNSNISRIIVACDEIAEVLDNTGLDKDEKAIVSQIESKFSTIARLGRADKVLSQIILDNSEVAEKISPNDQGTFYTNTSVLFRAYYVEDDCLEGVRVNGPTED